MRVELVCMTLMSKLKGFGSVCCALVDGTTVSLEKSIKSSISLAFARMSLDV